MTHVRDDGEPVTNGRRDRSAAQRSAQGNVLVVVVIFGGGMLISVLLAVALIACLEAFGWLNAATVVETFADPAHRKPWPST